MINIVIFCDDFRIKDNPALNAAASLKLPILLLFIYNENYLGRKLGEASKVFLHFTLKSFQNLLKKKYNASLIIKQGEPVEELQKIAKQIKISSVFFNRSYTKTQIETEAFILKQFNGYSFKGKVIFEPQEIGEAKIFTPFWKKCMQNRNLIRNPLKAPELFQNASIPSLKIEDLNLLQQNKTWYINLRKHWSFDYETLKINIEKFIAQMLPNYEENRNIPSINGTSRLSPYLRFGMISPNALLLKTEKISNQFAFEIGWREFAHNVLYFKPNIHKIEIKSIYSKFEWEEGENFKFWCKGETGEWLIDAGMQELWQTGYMHNRVRMLAASYLIKGLFVNWKKGEEWFWNCLVDACPAINPFSWQWVFGSGYDSSPYFRIFNPDLQLHKFDNELKYCKKFKPILGKKLINHSVKRQLALKKYKTLLK